MPVVRTTVVENAITTEQKQQLITRLTDAVVSVYGENLRPYTWVLIDEIKSGQWGIGGHTLTTEEVQSLMAGEAAVAA